MKVQDARSAAQKLSEAYRTLAIAYALGDDALIAVGEERVAWCEGVLDHALCTLEDAYEHQARVRERHACALGSSMSEATLPKER